MTEISPSPSGYDVVIAGGALAGSAAASLLLDRRPDLRILIVERSERFQRRVGESTVEVSAYFLGRVLGLTRYLNEEHVVKQGMRFWFAHPDSSTLEDCSELGNLFQTRLPAFQVDRSSLDEEVLSRARALGAEVWRSATITDVELHPGGEQLVTIRRGEIEIPLRARWFLDASGHAALLARREGWIEENRDHPISAVWARWRGLADWDGLDLARRYPRWAGASFAARGNATNHLVGDGWWAWMIPLKGGDVSVGVVYDERRVRWPRDGTPGERLKAFLSTHPVGREILAPGTWNDGDVHQRRRLAYSSKVFAGDGFALLGDASAFLDPLYSPGMDWVAYTVSAAAELVLEERSGVPIGAAIALHNRRFRRSYAQWFEAVYRDKYDYLGEFDLMRIAFLFDLGFYFWGVVSRPMQNGAAALREPTFSNPATAPIAWLMRTYNRRLATIARCREERSRRGLRNRGERHLVSGFTHQPSSTRALLQAGRLWASLELKEGWRSWRREIPRRTVENPATA